jgi:hypothetical protein
VIFWVNLDDNLSLFAQDFMKVVVFTGYVLVDAKSALNANHTASRTKLASHAQRAKDVPVNFP